MAGSGPGGFVYLARGTMRLRWRSAILVAAAARCGAARSGRRPSRRDQS